MLRHAKLVLLVFLAMFVVAAPTAVAESPVGDQYSAVDSGAASAGDSGAAPVQVRDLTSAQADRLPFTGGQVSLIALIGLALLAVGAAGLATSRRRASAATT
jgi:hypothetical protein